jgi:hypothetical protein
MEHEEVEEEQREHQHGKISHAQGGTRMLAAVLTLPACPLQTDSSHQTCPTFDRTLLPRPY